MIILLGGTGYVGGQFARTLQERGIPFAAPLRSEIDYGQFAALRGWLEKNRPEFLINAAGYTGKPNVDACEKNWADTLQGNTLFPAAAAHACASLGIPYGHVSSGCIFSGARVVEGGRDRIERDLNKNGLPDLLEKNRAAFRISLSAVRRAAFTAAARRWARKPCAAWARVTSGACASPLINLTIRATT
jgi:nucleoside-diphosphate-sugar epimerase